MNNVNVLIYVESRYKVNRKRVKKAVAEILTANSVTSPVEVSLAVVGDRKMKSLNKKYRNLDKTTNVLSFPLNEADGSQPEFTRRDAKPVESISGSKKNGDKMLIPTRSGQHDMSQNGVTRLGDIVISFPQVIRESARDEMMVDDKIDELVKHSMLHLLGIHHE